MSQLSPRYRVRHYKGGIYEYVGDAMMEATGEHMAIYTSLETSETWIRPYQEFWDLVEYEGKVMRRFKPIDEAT